MNLSNTFHNRLIQYINENTQFTNWIIPSDEDLALEYKLEYGLKNLGYEIENTMSDLGYQIHYNVFPDATSFVNAAKRGKVITIDKALDDKIEYRSSCTSIDCLIRLIKGYRSYPKYRNENTIQDMANAFDQNKPMKMPIVLQFDNDHFRVMGGNTRMDMAFIKGVNPKVLTIDLRKFTKKA